MDRSSRIAQVYGYAVCLIAVITILISLMGIVDGIFDYADPVRSERYHGDRSLVSYSAYKREVLEDSRDRAGRDLPVSAASPTPGDAELRAMFDEERAEHIGSTRFRAVKALVGGVLMIAVAAVLFTVHWRWLRRAPV